MLRIGSPTPPRQPPNWIKEMVAITLKGWEDCLSNDARKALTDVTELSEMDEKAEKEGVKGHRRCAILGREQSEVRIGPADYHPTVNTVLREGFTMELKAGSSPTVRAANRIGNEGWGFNAEKLREDGIDIGWRDREILFFLRFGFYDYSSKTPPVSYFSPHRKHAWDAGQCFYEVVQKEVINGWIGPAQPHPTSMPFQITTSSVERKKGGSCGLVWNASWPRPETVRGLVQVTSGEWRPVASNANTNLPECLDFECSSIEVNSESVAILAARSSAACRFSVRPLILRSGSGHSRSARQKDGNLSFVRGAVSGNIIVCKGESFFGALRATSCHADW